MKMFYEKYLKLAHIGKGANAHVYKVRHAELGYVRAIKVLTDYIEDKNDRTYQSFLKECKTLLAIGNGAHPSIVRIYGPDLIDNHAIVEMDYVQGITLDSYIKKEGFLDFEEIKTFIHDIVGALSYTHHDIYKFLMDPNEDDLQPDPNDGQKYVITIEKEAELVKKYGISHNDLHSNNVMRRDYDGRFILLDFGLAVQDGKCVKSSRMGDGNPEYQAPEKFDNETVDPRSDVYSLGILMYEMLAGRVPFKMQYDNDGKVSHRAINDVLNQHFKATPPPILPFRKAAFEKSIPGAVYKRDYPEWLDGVIMKCLAKDPQERYENAKVLLDDINNYLDATSFETEFEELNKKILDLSALYTSECKENEILTVETESLKTERNRLLKEYDAILATNEELKSRLETISNNPSNDKENFQDELRRLKSENAVLMSQWKFEKDEKERLMSYSPIKDVNLPQEIHKLRQDIKLLSAQCAHEKNEKEKLQVHIQKIENSGDNSLKKSNKRWKIATYVLSVALFCVGFWGFIMMASYLNAWDLYMDVLQTPPEWELVTTEEEVESESVPPEDEDASTETILTGEDAHTDAARPRGRHTVLTAEYDPVMAEPTPTEVEPTPTEDVLQ